LRDFPAEEDCRERRAESFATAHRGEGLMHALGGESVEGEFVPQFDDAIARDGFEGVE
jgi:hypothetical protein